MNSQENTSPRGDFYNDLLQVNAGLHALRQRMGAVVPSDFGWWFTFDQEEVIAGWWWKRDPQRRYQQDVRASTVWELCRKWAAVDWQWERSCARSAREEVATV